MKQNSLLMSQNFYVKINPYLGLYRLLSVPGGQDTEISRRLAHEGGKVVSLMQGRL
jgi:hypothetical protein